MYNLISVSTGPPPARMHKLRSVRVLPSCPARPPSYPFSTGHGLRGTRNAGHSRVCLW